MVDREPRTSRQGKDRRSLTVEAYAAELIARYRTDPPEGLRAMGIRPGASEASVLKAVFDVGLQALEADAADQGYRLLAQLWAHDPDRADIRAHQRAGRSRRPVEVEEVHPG